MKNRLLVNALLRLLRDIRAEKGYTLDELADRADVHRTSIGLLERGERTPTVQVAAQLAEALDMKLSDLVVRAEAALDEKGISEEEILEEFTGREAKKENFRNEAALISTTGFGFKTLKSAIESCYNTLDTIDIQLLEKNSPPISGLVELANLSSMVGNLLGAGVADASDGLYKRNRPHAYPDLMPLEKPAVDLEIKIALEKNSPKGHLPKAGTYITFRYVLADRESKYSRTDRGDTVWIWEVKVGKLKIEDFSISNTARDSGKTAVVKSAVFNAMKTVYYDPNLLPYKATKDGIYPGHN